MSVDAIFTPPDLAKQLVASARSRVPALVADFCAGDGGLLKAASLRWPKAKLIATDLESTRLKALQVSGPLSSGRCDFLNERSRRSCAALKGISTTVDLVLLNPPFSYRGSKTIFVHVDDQRFYCSPAIAFVLNCIPYLSKTGEIVAILPAGCIRSEKNESSWNWLSERFELTITGVNGHRTFNGYFPTTVIARLRKCKIRSNEVVVGTSRKEDIARPVVRLLRGAIPMHRYPKLSKAGKVPFVHTTELKGNGVDIAAKAVNRASAAVKGEFVLLPRVGQPSIEKIAHLATGGAVFSDCILGIECGTKQRAEEVLELLKNNWRTVARLYQGTGAPYVTVRDLAQVLSESGYLVESYHNGASSGLFRKALSRQSSKWNMLWSTIPISDGKLTVEVEKRAAKC